MSLILSRLDDPFNGFVVIELPLEAGNAGAARVVGGSSRGTVARVQVQPNGGLQNGPTGRQAMIDAIERVYCEGAVLMEALDASRRAE
jgi:hypothetical protein